MSNNRPKFQLAWNLFKIVKVDVNAVGKKIGGKVQQNIESRDFKNACPIRMSYVLNYAGIPVPKVKKYLVVSGADARWYMYRSNHMMEFLEETFGAADITAKSPKFSDFYGKKGVLVIQGNGWDNARGHVTLWDGAVCADSCHLLGDPDNGKFVPEVAKLWILP